jgi:hypothetical protein
MFHRGCAATAHGVAGLVQQSPTSILLELLEIIQVVSHMQLLPYSERGGGTCEWFLMHGGL